MLARINFSFFKSIFRDLVKESWEIVHKGGSGGLAGTVWAGPLFEFLTLLIAVNHYKTTYLPKSLNRNSLI